MKSNSHPSQFRLAPYWLAASSMLFSLHVSATLLDGFPSGTRTGWTDTANGGSFFTSVHAFTIGTANASGSLTYSLKTSQAFSTVATHTLEFTVDVKSVRPAGTDTNALAILAWVTNGGSVLASGYSLAVGAADLQIRRDTTVIYQTNFAGGLQNSNITMVLRLTPSGTDVIVKARVYKTGGGNGSLLFEQSVTNASGIIASGNAGLGVLNQASATGAGAVFDNLQVFDMTDSLLDDFSGSVNFAFWSKFTDVSAGQSFRAVESGGTVTLASPTNGIGNVRGYHIANVSGPYDNTLFVGKQYNVWWSTIDDASVDYPANNYRLIQTYSGEGTSCRIESRLEDLSVDVNDPGRVRFQNVFVDTAGKDLTGPNPDIFNGGSPYLNFSGFFVLEVFNGGTPIGAVATFDNARFSQTPPPNGAPFFTEVTPVDGANFISSSSVVQFHVIDDVSTPLNSIAVTLNGVRYTNGHPNVTITPTSGTSSDRLFKLTGALAANVNYVGSIQATDNVGLASIPLILHFDTFSTSLLQVESEEYNFLSGSFIDNPILIAEGGTDSDAYNGKVGTAEVDYHDNRGSTGPGYDADHTFRTDDAVRTSNTGDPARAKYAAVPGSLEEVVQDIHDGDWMNYTHTYPAGTYNVFIRESLFQLNLPQAVSTLERVTGDRTQPNQTTTPLGAFVTTETGFGSYRNVPLTDAYGNLVVVRFTGAVDTLRVTEQITGNYDDNVGQLAQNYLVLAPAPDPGTLRPIVSSVSPLPGSTVQAVFPVTTVSIANRETTVDTNTVVLQINGVTVSPTITSNATGADVSYALTPLPPTGSIITNTLIFADSGAISQTNTWTWTLTYPFLRGSNSLPVGSLIARGFDYRMVQTDNGGVRLGDSLLVAEQQLAIPPVIPYEVTYSTNGLPVLDWEGGTPPSFPGAELIAGNYKNTAAEIFGYMQLTAGPHRFHVRCDRGFAIYSGALLKDPSPVAIIEISGANFLDGTFDFVAEANGLYPTRIVWYQEDGSADTSFHLKSVNLTDNSQVLVNDPTDPAGVVKVYDTIYQVDLYSSTTVNGPYTVDGTALVNRDAKTVTVSTAGATKFYRLQTPTAVKVTNLSKVGSSVVLTYQFQ